ncbi:MAG: tRNA guanosine(34) transglycosylase Tgt [Oligoflexia bacterium]
MSRLNFEIEAEAPGSRARAARLKTLHSEVLTPVFMPVGTQATVRAQTFDTLESLGAQVILANTYHLMLRPGIEVFRRLGGIHSFNGWKRSVLTDSGGFQVFSLPTSSINDEQGAVFRSHVDGSRVELTPERSIEMQKAIGSDIMMVLDQCVPSTCDHATALEALHRTHRWAKRSLEARAQLRGDLPQALFGIVQGACFEDLRRMSASQITELAFDGFAIGGLAVGETKTQREDFTELTAALLPRDLPRYLMGVGTPIDLLEAVHRGVDMFDCVLPTLLAQQGVVFTSRGRLDLRRGIYKFSEMQLDPDCSCTTCTRYSRAYLSHLIKAKEVLGWQLLGTHNLHFYLSLMSAMRAAILEGTFAEFYRSMREPLARQTDYENPPNHPVRKRKPSDKRPLLRGDYRVEMHPSGMGRIVHGPSGEVMHPVADPRQEARELYVEGSGFAAALASKPGRPLVLWDVGMGAATNAMAAIQALESCQDSSSRLILVSFERDLDPMLLATSHPHSFPHLKHRAPHLLLQKGCYSSPDERLEWQLVQGDFEKTAFEQKFLPDFVFYDPFSSRTDGPLWDWQFLQKLRLLWNGRAVRVANYSNSTAQRASVLAAGFWIASGPASARRPDTSIWLTPEAASGSDWKARLLGVDWLERWQRSSAPAPESVLGSSQREEFLALVRRHPQFLKLPPASMIPE